VWPAALDTARQPFKSATWIGPMLVIAGRDLAYSLSAIHSTVMDMALGSVAKAMWAVALGEESGPTGNML
jgi:hypothetical protein